MKNSIRLPLLAVILAGCGATPVAQTTVSQLPPLAAKAVHLTVPPQSQIRAIGPSGKIKLGDAFISLIPSPSMVAPGGTSMLWPQISSMKQVSLAEFQWMPSCGTVNPGVTYEYEPATFFAPAFASTCIVDANVLIAYTDGTTDSGWVSSAITVMGQ